MMKKMRGVIVRKPMPIKYLDEFAEAEDYSDEIEIDSNYGRVYNKE